MRFVKVFSVVCCLTLVFACGKKKSDSNPSQTAPGNDGGSDGPGDDGEGGVDPKAAKGGPAPGSLALGSVDAIAQTGCPDSSLGESTGDSCAIQLATPSLSENLDAASPGSLAINVGSGLVEAATICGTTSTYCESIKDNRSGWTKSDELRCAIFNRRPVDFRCKIEDVDNRLQASATRASEALRRCMTRAPTMNNFDILDESNPIAAIDFEHYLQCTEQLNGPDDALADVFLSFGKKADDWYVRMYGTSGAGNMVAKIDADDNMEIWGIAGGEASEGQKKEMVHVVTNSEQGIVEFSQFIADAWPCGMRAVLNANYLRLEGYGELGGDDCADAVDEDDLEELCFDISTESFAIADLSACNDAGLSFTLPLLKRNDFTPADIDAFRAIDPDGVIDVFIPDPLYQVRNSFFRDDGGQSIKSALQPLTEEGVVGDFTRNDLWACVDATEEKSYDLAEEAPFSSLTDLKFEQLLACAAEEAFYGFAKDNFYARKVDGGSMISLRAAKDGSTYEIWDVRSADNQASVTAIKGAGKRLELTTAGDNVDIACGGQIATDGSFLYLKGLFMEGTPTPQSTTGGDCDLQYWEEICAKVDETFVELSSLEECESRKLHELELPQMHKDVEPALDMTALSGIIAKSFPDLAKVSDFADNEGGSGTTSNDDNAAP